MQFALTTMNGKTISGGKAISEYLKKTNGNYIINIEEENTLSTPKNCRDAYFFKVDLVRDATGSERYNIHEDFKKEANIASTKNFTVVDWRNFIKLFQEYVFEKMDMLI